MTVAAAISVGRDTFDVAYGSEQATAAREILERVGVGLIGSAQVATTPDAASTLVRDAIAAAPELIVLIQATFADASVVIDLAEASDVPILVWSFPEERTGGNLRLNSLCGANLAAYSLRRRDHRCGFVHVDPAHPDAAARVEAALARVLADTATTAAASSRVMEMSAAAQEAAAATDTLVRSSRIGVIGDGPVGFEPCIGVDDELAERFGVIVQRLELEELFDAARRASDEQVVEVTHRIETTMELPERITEVSIEPSARLYCGMRDHVERNGFSAFATRCWPECMVDFGGAACTPQALMADDGVSGTCEADVLGAIPSVMLRSVAGSAPFIADLVDVDESDGTSVLWHCGVAPPEMAGGDQPVEGAVHPNRKIPLVNQFALRPGRVTLARLSQCGSGYSLVVGGGEVLDRPRPFSGTSGVVRWDEPIEHVVATVFEYGLEHHLGLVYGDHQDVLIALAQRWGIPVVRLGIDR